MSEENIPAVRYRPVPGHPGYRAGSDGSIWSRWTNRGFLGPDWHRLKGTVGSEGYVLVRLRTGRNRTVLLGAHRLVLLAFRGPPPAPGMQAAHRDGTRTNNAVRNLRWRTPAGNRADSRAHGTEVRGSRSKRARLDERRVALILLLVLSGELTKKAAAARFGVVRGTVDWIVTGRKWKHVPRPTRAQLRAFRSRGAHAQHG
jgi:hypothetical protein